MVSTPNDCTRLGTKTAHEASDEVSTLDSCTGLGTKNAQDKKGHEVRLASDVVPIVNSCSSCIGSTRISKVCLASPAEFGHLSFIT